MLQLVFEKLYIFYPEEQLAKFVDFSPGSNVITSDSENGNSVGKTTIVKTIYHGLGADCKFTGDWPTKKIITVEFLNIDGTPYQVYRNDRLFRIFRHDELLYEVSNRKQLSECYEEIFGYSIKLPNKSDDHLEIAPPAFLFVLNYLEKPKGSYFESFESLQEYSDVKDLIIYSHLGAFNEEYYKWKKDYQRIKELKDKSEEKHRLLTNMIERIKMEVTDTDYSANLDALREETKAYSRVYNELVSDLQDLKKQIIQKTNEGIEIQHQINSLRTAFKDLQKGIDSVNSTHKCPLCSTHIDDLISVRAKEYNQREALLITCDELSRVLDDLNRSIERTQERYTDKLNELDNYKKRLTMNQKETSDIIAQEGAIKIRDQLIMDLSETFCEFQGFEENLKDINRAIRQYDDRKKEINREYSENMKLDRNKFNVQEISDTNIKSIQSSFKLQSSSNNRLSSIIWHINLLKLKNTFNPSVIQFPIVFDSPTGDEIDDAKRDAIWEYILFHNLNSQIICSSLGFTEEMKKKYMIDKVIQIKTPKYKLLNKEDYTLHCHILEKYNSIIN